MVTTFTYCRSSRKSLGNAAHMSAAYRDAVQCKWHLHEERKRPGIPQKFAIAVSIHRSPRTFRNMALSSGRRPRLAFMPCSRRNQRCTYSIASNWRALTAPKPYRGRSSAGHHISHHIASNHSRALVSSVKMGFDRMLWHYSLLGK